MSDTGTIRELSLQLVESLAASGRSVTTAESCTGGWIAKAITDVPGSSDVFGYGFVTYSNAAKTAMLGVAEPTLESVGAVSEETVIDMVRGALVHSGADFGVAVSGIAGPDGGTPDKPVGIVWFAWGVRSEAALTERTECVQFDGDRDAVRRQTVEHALRGLQARAV